MQLPQFLIIGAQKAGTTSLYAYLAQHPQIFPATEKEVHYFDLNFHNGFDWYRSQFPSPNQSPDQKEGWLTGEATPYYLFHPCVPQRVFQIIPQVKLIVLLREPVARAISHYYHEVRLGFEHLPLVEAIAQEASRLVGEEKKLLSDRDYYSFNHQHYSYLARSKYLEQLQRWMNFFPKNQLLILKAEDLYANPSAVVSKTLEFLGLPDYQLETYEKYNLGTKQSQPSPEMQADLEAYFHPHNQELKKHFGLNLGWD